MSVKYFKSPTKRTSATDSKCMQRHIYVFLADANALVSNTVVVYLCIRHRLKMLFLYKVSRFQFGRRSEVFRSTTDPSYTRLDVTASATSGPAARPRSGFQRRRTTAEMSSAAPCSLLGSNFRRIDFFYRPATTCQSAERSPGGRVACRHDGPLARQAAAAAALERSGPLRSKNGSSRPTAQPVVRLTVQRCSSIPMEQIYMPFSCQRDSAPLPVGRGTKMRNACVCRLELERFSAATYNPCDRYDRVARVLFSVFLRQMIWIGDRKPRLHT